MYYCDCVESSQAKGLPLPKNSAYIRNAGIFKSNQVEILKDGTCVHCGHYAVFSREPISRIAICDANSSDFYADMIKRAKAAVEAGMTEPEIAEHLNVNEGNVKYFLREAK